MATTKYLCLLYTDPITGKEWVEITDPMKGIIGVASSSEAEPAKKANFPIVYEKAASGERADIYKQFEGKTKYSEWQFVYGQLQTAGSIKGLETKKF